MHLQADSEEHVISTGHLPPAERVQAVVAEAHSRFRAIDDGDVADYIPALARQPRELFGLCIASVSGAAYVAGDVDTLFSIQSVSKPFVFALICQQFGPNEARRLLGVEPPAIHSTP